MNEETRKAALEVFNEQYHIDPKYPEPLELEPWFRAWELATQAAYERTCDLVMQYGGTRNQRLALCRRIRALANESSGKGEKE